MRLSQLADGYSTVPVDADPLVSGVTEDSRRVAPGMVFVAVRGTSLDGHAYIADAVSRGAAAIVVERTGTVPPGVPSVRVASSRHALAILAARFYGTTPAELTHLSLIGFTGTFGKTSTSDILRTLLDAGGAHTGVIGSLGARYGSLHDSGNGLTTPGPVELHRSIRALQNAGATTVILEVTSHALKLGRAEGLMFSGGLLAAVMPGEHTDFHRSYEDYVEAKRAFLKHLAPHALLAFDADNLAARRIASGHVTGRTACFSIEGGDADVQVYNVVLDRFGATFSLRGRVAGPASDVRMRSPLLGRGHLRNVALALTYAVGDGLPVAVANATLATLTPLRRRMERYEIAGRTILDDTAAHGDSLRATFEVAAMLPHDGFTVVHAIRGNRGADVNRRNAIALADLCALYGVEPLIVTSSADSVGPTDFATAAEIDATRQALVARGRRFVWHENLEDALAEAVNRTPVDGLIVLVGAQGMNEAKNLLLR
jgi:UDP-N-acetylmuramoyl-L-alanyl-D-glutamate--2,6-diaminopimelate ligase